MSVNPFEFYCTEVTGIKLDKCVDFSWWYLLMSYELTKFNLLGKSEKGWISENFKHSLDIGHEKIL